MIFCRYFDFAFTNDEETIDITLIDLTKGIYSSFDVDVSAQRTSETLERISQLTKKK